MTAATVIACMLWLAGWAVASAAEQTVSEEVVTEAALEAAFSAAEAVLQTRCVDCHDAASHEGGVQLDTIGAIPTAATRSVFERVIRELREGTMPPDDAAPLEEAAGAAVLAWAEQGLAAFDARPVPRNGSVRRLTVDQVRRTLQSLLALEEDVTGGLPADAVSKEGFTNQIATLQLSALQLEASLAAAERAVDLALVDETRPPAIQRFRVELGKDVHPQPTSESLILGHISRLLPSADVLITEPEVHKPFACEPVRMQRQFRFIEGYQGNDTVRGWREFAGIEHAVFACLRGSDGDDAKDFVDPRGRGHEITAEGLLLRPSIPSARYLGVGSKYGPLPNFKIAVRELPHHGRFRVTVRASCVDDLLVVPPGEDGGELGAALPAEVSADGQWVCDLPQTGTYLVRVQPAGVTARQPQPDGQAAADAHELSLSIGSQQVTTRWMQPACAVVRLPAGPVRVRGQYAGPEPIEQVAFVPLADSHPWAVRLAAMQQRRPWLGVHLGLRRDCGSTLAPVGPPQRVESRQLQDFVFEGAIANFPDPHVEADNPNYLAGLREIAVRSEYTSDRDMPRLLVRSIEFEGPWHEQWPPPSHRIVCDVPGGDAADPEQRARAILGRFATRAFRRPVTDDELEGLLGIWRRSRSASGDERQALRDGLVATLVAPQFLFLIEDSGSPAPEPLSGFELASKLSYFLWNGPPDERLLALAANGTLHAELPGETDRLLADPRFDLFADRFAAEWLRLDHFDVVETDQERFPHLSRHVRPHLRQQPARLLAHLLRSNAAATEVITSETLVANEVVADYLGIGKRVESGWVFVPVEHGRDDLGGVVTLPAVLAGLSNGREANPVKRGAWLARSIIAQPPADPPPNVPVLDDLTQLSLRERLERHRSAKGCRGCHEGIDPWGLPFEAYAADGLADRSEADVEVDAHSQLPDGTQVADFAGFREYLLQEQADRVAYSFAWHLATYACGRLPDHHEERWLSGMASDVQTRGGGLRDILQQVVTSDMFLMK